ncbi:MAG: single-stranded DNA-binding protein [Clostridiales bacterium]|jgi:single-strand DNA-binding protein|nr:single-stranded DNA-binding protein [Clostridiales bacterium]
MNKVILMGRLTKDPEIRYSQGSESPTCIAHYTLAVDRRFKREGEPTADFINCVAFAKQGEFAEKYLKKGMMIAVTGRLQIRTYDDQQNQRRWFTEIILDDQYFTESRAAFEARSQQQNNAYSQSYAPPSPPPQSQYQPGPHEYAQPSKPKNDIPPDFFIDQELNDDDLPF